MGESTVYWWGKRPLGRPRRRWEDIIKKALQDLDGDLGLIWLRIETGGRHS